MPPYKIDKSKIHWGTVSILAAEQNKINEVMDNGATRTNLNIVDFIRHLGYQVQPYTTHPGWLELDIGRKQRLYFTVDGDTITYQAIGHLGAG